MLRGAQNRTEQVFLRFFDHAHPQLHTYVLKDWPTGLPHLQVVPCMSRGKKLDRSTDYKALRKAHELQQMTLLETFKPLDALHVLMLLLLLPSNTCNSTPVAFRASLHPVIQLQLQQQQASAGGR